MVMAWYNERICCDLERFDAALLPQKMVYANSAFSNATFMDFSMANEKKGTGIFISHQL